MGAIVGSAVGSGSCWDSGVGGIVGDVSSGAEVFSITGGVGSGSSAGSSAHAETMAPTNKSRINEKVGNFFIILPETPRKDNDSSPISTNGSRWRAFVGEGILIRQIIKQSSPLHQLQSLSVQYKQHMSENTSHYMLLFSLQREPTKLSLEDGICHMFSSTNTRVAKSSH